MKELRLIPLAAVVVIAACSSAPQTAPAPVTAPATAAPVATASDEIRVPRVTAQDIAEARADSARIPYTEGDVRFMTGMIGHHAQAIQMSLMAPSHGASPSVRTLAARIINAQRDEIYIMQHWLAERQKPWPHVAASGEVHGADHAAHHGGQGAMMAGMLTPEQMRQLDAARGTEFDRLFLTFMIQHHSGAVAMVRELLSAGGAAHNDTVFRMAGDINVDQTTEIARMQKMLAALQ